SKGAGSGDLAAVARDDEEVEGAHVGVVELHVRARRLREALLGCAELAEGVHEVTDLGDHGWLGGRAVDHLAAWVARVEVVHPTGFARHATILSLCYLHT